MIHNGTTGKCLTCGGEAFVTVHADGFDDLPATFTMKNTCKKGPCPAAYVQLTAQQMHESHSPAAVGMVGGEILSHRARGGKERWGVRFLTRTCGPQR